MILTHLRRNVVAYLALLVAMTGTSYAAAAVANGSITTAKLHNNAVTSTKIKNGTIKSKDIKKPTWVHSITLGPGTPPAIPDLISIAPHDFSLPTKGRVSVTVFIPTIGGSCDSGNPDQPTIGLYIDNVAIPGTAATVPPTANDRSVQLTATLPLNAGAHSGRVGITCSGGSQPNNINSPGAKTWTIILTS